MHEDIDLFRTKTKQPVRFDNFKSLVHQRGRIDRDLRAHRPRWVTHRVGNRGVLHFVLVFGPEGATGRSENDASHFFRSLST